MTEQEITERIIAADQPEEVLPFLEAVGSYDDETRWTVIGTAFRTLAALHYIDLHELGLELSYKLPFRERDWLQDFLIDWATQLSDEQRESIYTWWLSSLAKDLVTGTDAQRLKGVLCMVNTIGTRTPEIEEGLERLTDLTREGNVPVEVSDQALWALTSLGYPNEETLIRRLEQRLKSEDHVLYWLLPATRILTPLSLIPVILDMYRLHRDERNYNSLLWVIADLALANPEEADTIWEAIETEITPSSLRTIEGAGNVTSQINSPKVVDFFLRQINTSTVSGDGVTGGISPHYQIYNRMRNLSCSRHIDAYHHSSVRHSIELIEGIRQDACMDTAKETTWTTVESRLKRMAWDIGLRLNLDKITEWFPEALVEASSYVFGAVANLAGYIRATSAMPILHSMVKKEDTEITAGVASIRALGNIGTRVAFDVLMDSCIKMGNDVPQALPDAIANSVLLMNDCAPLVESLINDSMDPLMRMACAAAAEQVAAKRAILLEPFKKQIVMLLSSPTNLPKRMAAYLIGSLGYLTVDEIGSTLLGEFAKRSDEEAMRALEALARWDRLVENTNLLENLGLTVLGNRWTVREKLDYRGTFTTGLLYTKHPQTFSPAAVRILSDDGYFEAVQVIWLLQAMSSDSLTSDVEEALLKRIKNKTAERQIETEALDALMILSPDRFVSELHYNECAHWHAPARKAVAVCLGRIKNSVSSSSAATKTLQFLLSDPVLSVRREAARSLQVMDSTSLLTESQRLLASELPRDRECGIQGACWIVEDQTFQVMFTQARHDTEKLVRNAAREGCVERRERVLARVYLGHVLANNEDVLEVWHFGQALRDYGDDETVYRLQEAAQNPAFAPNKQAWMGWIAEGVKSRWDEKERKRSSQ